MTHEAVRHVEYQGADRQRAVRPGTQWDGVGMFIFAGSRVRVEIDASDELAVIVDLIGFGERIPLRRLPWPDVDAEHVLGQFEGSVADAAVREPFCRLSSLVSARRS